MWQQGPYQQWPVNQQQSSYNVDWAALAQAWRQNKDVTNQPPQNVNPVGNNGTTIQAPPMQNPQMQWAQQQSWQQQQWNNNGWNSGPPAGGFVPQQWQRPPVNPALHLAPSNNESKAPLPPLPPEEMNEPDAPPGTRDDIYMPDIHTNQMSPSDNQSPEQTVLSQASNQSILGEYKSNVNQEPSGYDTPPLLPTSQDPPVQKMPDSSWNEQWKPSGASQSDNWGTSQGTPPPGTQWSSGNTQQWYSGGPGGQISQYSQGQNMGMVNSEMAATVETSKRKLLPAWIREGLERMEHEKQKQFEKDQFVEKPQVVTNRRKSSGSEGIKSRFDSGSEAESDAELPQEEAEVEQVEVVSEEAKNEMMLMKVRRMLTEVLLEVTDAELQVLVQDVYNKETKAPAKQLAKSSALSSIGQLGVVAGYSSDEEGSINDEVDGDDVKTGSTSSCDEENIQRKLDEFNKKQMVRIKNLEDSELEKQDKAKIETDVVAETLIEPSRNSESNETKQNKTLINDEDKSQSTDSPNAKTKKPYHSHDMPDLEKHANKRHKKDRSDTDTDDEIFKRHSRRRSHSRSKRSTSPSSYRSRSGDRHKSSKSSKESSKKSTYRSRSRSRERKQSSRDHKHSHSSERRESHSSSRKRRSSRSRSPRSSRKYERQHSRTHRGSPEKKVSKSDKRDRKKSHKRDDSLDHSDRERSTHKRHYSRKSPENRSHRSSSNDASDSDDHHREYKKKSRSVKKRRDSTKGKKKSSSDDSSSLSSGESSQEDSTPQYKESKSHKADKYVRKKSKSSKRKNKH